MGNKNIEQYYTNMAKNITDAKATRNKAKDSSKYDIQLMKSFSGENKTLLDLGAGTGLLINDLTHNFKQIIAIEKYPEFSKFITKSPQTTIINSDLLLWENQENIKADIVSLFGVIPYFDIQESTTIYKNAFKDLKDNGLLIVKHQMGIEEDIIINGFSEELQTHYYSEYRQVDKEITLLKNIGFTNIEKIDIYPPEYNRWDNTHFYALIAHK